MKHHKYKRSNRTHRKKRIIYGGEYEPGEECSICMDEGRRNTNECIFVCNRHRFCVECTRAHIDTSVNLRCPVCRADINDEAIDNFNNLYPLQNAQQLIVGIVQPNGLVNIGVRIYDTIRNLDQILINLIAIGMTFGVIYFYIKLGHAIGNALESDERMRFQWRFIISYLNQTGQLDNFDFRNFNQQDFINQLNQHDNPNTSFIYRPIGGTKESWLLDFFEKETDIDTTKIKESTMISCTIDTKLPMTPKNKKIIKQALKIKQNQKSKPPNRSHTRKHLSRSLSRLPTILT